MSLAIKYAFFALLATLLNIAAQDATLGVYSGAFALPLAMACGTLCGLVLKYPLDKRYIFNYRTKCLSEDGRKFIVYSFFGLFTTLLFWGTEMGFDRAFKTADMRHLGAALGLGLGYLLKYKLDKKFVFARQTCV